MATPARDADSAPHQPAADAAVATTLIDGQRTKEQGWPSWPGADMPESHRADDLSVLFGDQR